MYWIVIKVESASFYAVDCELKVLVKREQLCVHFTRSCSTEPQIHINLTNMNRNMNMMISCLFWLCILCNISCGMDCIGCGCWHSSSIRRRRREERQRQRLAASREPLAEFPPTQRPTTHSPTLSPTFPPTFVLSYQQRTINHFCPSGTYKCVLDNNNLQSIQNIRFPSSIQQLYISRNHITTLENVEFPVGLTFLCLADNKITFTDGGFVNLSYLRSLQVLILENNRITSLNNLLLPRSLRELNLRNNQFQSISLGPNVDRLNELHRLDLGLNHLEIVTGNLTKQLPQQLLTLKVDMNQIQIFGHVTLPLSLQRLDLRNNPLTCFDVINLKTIMTRGINIQFEGTQITNGQLTSKVRNIPTIIWNATKVNTTKECQVCCEEFVNGDVIRILPCMHQYHCKCVDKWLGQKETCPECRHPIDQNDPPPEAMRDNDNNEREGIHRRSRENAPHRVVRTPQALNW